VPPLIRSIFRLHVKGREYTESELENRRRRLIRLAYEVLDEIVGLNNDNAAALAPRIMDVLTLAGTGDILPTIVGLKAIYLEGFFTPPKPEEEKRTSRKKLTIL